MPKWAKIVLGVVLGLFVIHLLIVLILAIFISTPPRADPPQIKVISLESEP